TAGSGLRIASQQQVIDRSDAICASYAHSAARSTGRPGQFWRPEHWVQDYTTACIKDFWVCSPRSADDQPPVRNPPPPSVASFRDQSLRTQFPRQLNDDIRRKTSAPGSLPDGICAFCFVEAICLSFIRRQERHQPFDTGLIVDLDDSLEVGRRGVQRRGEISFYHE